jgi:SAM-dependent methyltransferase
MVAEGTQLDVDDVQFEPASFTDDVGRVFYYNGSVYRGITSGYVDHVVDILNSDWFGSAVEVGLVDTEIVNIEFEHYPLVIKHKKISPRSYCSEWPSVMLKEAAVMTVQLSIYLHKRNYCLKDCHPWNILFDFTDPTYIDFGSIKSKREFKFKPWMREFRTHYLLPLYMKKRGWHAFSEYFFKVESNLPKRILNSRFGSFFPIWYNKLITSSMSDLDKLYVLYEKLKNLPIKCDMSEWSDYTQNEAGRGNGLNQKQKSTQKLLNELFKEGYDMIDVGCNKGWYSELAENMGYNVVAIDLDEQSLCDLYNRSNKHNNSILPIRLDLTSPTSSHGIRNVYSNSFERISGDVTLMLAVIHHLVFKQNQRFRDIVKIIDDMTGKYAIIEFIPPNDQYVSDWITSEYDWYNKNNFIDLMCGPFELYENKPSSPDPRELLVFSK